MTDWPFVIHERVRFRDVDSFGHVNNAVYSTCLEQARLDALGGLGGLGSVRVEIDFRAEVNVGEEIEVRSRCTRVGTKSVELEHEILAAGRLAAEAKSVLVGFDYERRASAPITDQLRERLSGTRASA